MKMTQFANFANNATKQILGGVELELENLTRMFDSSISFDPYPNFIPDVAGVRFIDYDGTLIYFIPFNDVLTMNEMPPLINHKTLIAQNWNWSLEDIKTYMTKYPNAKMTVGQTLIPVDGKTHMILDVGPRLTIPLMIQQTVSEGVTINWGDDSEEETIEGTGTVTTSHTYESEGEYDITLDVADECTLYFGGNVNDNYYNVFGEYSILLHSLLLEKVFFGNGVTSIGQYAFYYCYNLTNLTIPDGVTSIEGNAFNSCYSLTSLTIPNKATNIGNSAFLQNLKLETLSLSNSIATIEQGAFANCYSIKNIALPDGIENASNNIFGNCYFVSSLTIPDSVTSIGQKTFGNEYMITSLTIPNGVTSIGQQAFVNSYTLHDLTVLAETPPTLANVNAFSKLPSDCTIYVPYGKGDTYKAASGWSTWASQIQELPE